MGVVVKKNWSNVVEIESKNIKNFALANMQVLFLSHDFKIYLKIINIHNIL